MTVLLVGLRLVSKRPFSSLTTGATLVPVMLGIALIVMRQVVWTNQTERSQRLRLLPVIAIPLIAVVFLTVVARFAQIGHG